MMIDLMNALDGRMSEREVEIPVTAGTLEDLGRAISELKMDLICADQKARNSVGQWISVRDEMPDDEVSVLAWSTMYGDAMLCYHDSEILERRGDSGWILADSSRVILGVSHWCGDIQGPADL